MQTLKDIMSTDVATVSPSETVQKAAQLMTQKNIGSLVIMETQGIVGILTERDLFKKIISENKDASKTQVGQIMQQEVVCATTNTTILEALSLLTQHGFRRLPVMEDGKLEGIATLTDIEAAHYSELKTELAMKNNFLALTSHELKTPLTAVIIYTELLKKHIKNPTEKQTEFIDTIYSESLKLRDLILNILELAKIDSKKKRYDIKPQNLVEVIEDSISDMERLFYAKHINLVIDIEKDLPQTPIDRESMQNVLNNLLSNAIKFSPEKTRVTIKSWQDKDSVYISVEDKGCGIKQEVREKIFNRFYQAESTISRKHGGTGLGLAICRENMQAHQGEIGVETPEGGGSRFTIRLPKTREGGE